MIFVIFVDGQGPGPFCSLVRRNRHAAVQPYLAQYNTRYTSPALFAHPLPSSSPRGVTADCSPPCVPARVGPVPIRQSFFKVAPSFVFGTSGTCRDKPPPPPSNSCGVGKNERRLCRYKAPRVRRATGRSNPPRAEQCSRFKCANGRPGLQRITTPRQPQHCPPPYMAIRILSTRGA